MKKNVFVHTIILFMLLLVSNEIFAFDYKYVRKYNAKGQVIENARVDEYISVTVTDYEFMGYTNKLMVFGMYQRYGEDWNYVSGPTYGYNSTNNGWYIFVCTIGYHSDYIYVKSDMSTVRLTFMAGGNGCYKEYVRAKRPTIDRLAPTR